jgi:hypothetical protein
MWDYVGKVNCRAVCGMLRWLLLCISSHADPGDAKALRQRYGDFMLL